MAWTPRELADQLDALSTEIQQLRDEIHALRQEMSNGGK